MECVRTKSKAVLCALTMLVGVGSMTFAQEFDWTLKLTSGEKLSNVALQRLSNDTLYFLHKKNFADVLLLDSLVWMSREKSGAVLPATLIGAAAGGALGVSLKPVARDQDEANVYSAAFGVVVGGVAGFLGGSFIQSDELVDLSTMDRETKRKWIVAAIANAR